MTRRGFLTPSSAFSQLSVACTGPPEAVTLPASSASAPAGTSASPNATAAPARTLRRRRALIGPRFGVAFGLGRLGALLGPRLVELDAPARVLVAALLQRQPRPERPPRSPLEAGHRRRREALLDELARRGRGELLARLRLPDDESAAGVLARPARVALAVLDDVAPADRTRAEVRARDAHVLERGVEDADGLTRELGDVLHELLAAL